MELALLNHACIKLSYDSGVKILFDPWLEGYCFEEAWGLRFDNPGAWDQLKDCDYLWISHFHTDHFHIQTLKKLLEINPEIKILCNHSYNFSLVVPMTRLGFKNIIPFPERKEIHLEKDIRVTRFPTTGIDNMLYVQSDEGTLLNYNDCNVPYSAMNKLKKKIGKVDILLNNFNHAQKIMAYPIPSDAEIKTELKAVFAKQIEVFRPKFTIPMASYHYYRAPENKHQNKSMLTISELTEIDQTVVPLKIGEKATFVNQFESCKIELDNEVVKNEKTTKVRNKKYTLEELKEASKKFCRKINSGFLRITFWIPPLIIKVSDLDKTISLKISKGKFEEIEAREEYHIAASSQELFTWWDKPYGTDSFVVGGHFDLNNEQMFPLRIKVLFGLLTENKLDLKKLILMLFHPKGIVFLYNRREEIVSLLLSNNYVSGPRK